MSDKLELPYYSSDELWRELTTERIGFYTSKTSSKIPSTPGVYAWFLPLELKGDASSVIKKYKEIFSYDSCVKSSYLYENDIFFQWQNFNISLKAKSGYKEEKTHEKYWDELQGTLLSNDLKSMRQILLLCSIFSKPLYVGLTKNLINRYEQHTTENIKNSFNRRFQDFSKIKDLNISVKDLIFTCVSLPFTSDAETIEKELKVLEYLLKNISGPVFGEK